MAMLLAFMTLLTFIQVVMRYLFNSGWVWSLEATTYSFAALVLIGMSYGVRTRTHITVDLFLSRLRPSDKALCQYRCDRNLPGLRVADAICGVGLRRTAFSPRQYGARHSGSKMGTDRDHATRFRVADLSVSRSGMALAYGPG